MSNPEAPVSIDPWYLSNLVCPVDRSPLTYDNDSLLSSAGRRYPVVDGVPVMLLQNVQQTLHVASGSINRANRDRIDERAPELYLETLGLTEEEKDGLIDLVNRRKSAIDPVVMFIVGATNGIAYRHLIGNLTDYPIPDIRLPDGGKKTLLDLGCNWGRWCIAAARRQYSVVGIDPSLGAVMAARRVARQLGHPEIRYVVADARYLPFKEASFDRVFSYSVLQHFSKENVRLTLTGVGRVLKPQGISLIQMPNFLGIRSLQHQFRRRWREAEDFEVRYWSVPELEKTFKECIGPSRTMVDCYFGLGLQKSDIAIMRPILKLAVRISELLRFLSKGLPFLKYVADSIYVQSVRENAGRG